MRTPDFWVTDGLPARLLEPAGLIYAAATRRRMAKATPLRLPVPVVCVGNLVAGGAGKTPVALAVMAALRARDCEAHFLTRGHGGRFHGPVRVNPVGHSSSDVGDEALLLAAQAPTWVARDRAAGGRHAVDAGAQAVVMDDGHQNPALVKDLSLVVVDGVYGFGNRRVIPAGPLREPIGAGLRRADAVVLLGPDQWGVARRVPAGVPLVRAALVPGPEGQRLAGRRVVAFAGIGRPDKFFDTLRALGAQVVATHPFADHYPYAETDIQPILDEAYALGAVPVTTAKDAVRLPLDQRQQVDVLTVSVAWEDVSVMGGLLDHLVGA